jgi:hypothetical protein
MVSLCDSIAVSQLYNNKPALERVKQQLMDTPGSTSGCIHTIRLVISQPSLHSLQSTLPSTKPILTMRASAWAIAYVLLSLSHINTIYMSHSLALTERMQVWCTFLCLINACTPTCSSVVAFATIVDMKKMWTSPMWTAYASAGGHVFLSTSTCGQPMRRLVDKSACHHNIASACWLNCVFPPKFLPVCMSTCALMFMPSHHVQPDCREKE